MIDLIKTFILGIWIEKKYRYLFLFILFTMLYRFAKWLAVIVAFEMTPVKFISINNDGSLNFVYLKKYEQTIYPNGYQMPTKNGKKNENYDVKGVIDTKQCEKDFFKIYETAVLKIINSSTENKFIIHFDKKFPKNIGEISYFDNNDNEKYIYETLHKQGFIFDIDKDINYCNEVKKFR